MEDARVGFTPRISFETSWRNMANNEKRSDIQGLRAVAVLLVLAFHIWPKFMLGGYVGVDVFFVISGFLITGLLVREADATGTISLRGFYARRIRRLLPVACVVLVAVAGASILWLPIGSWRDAMTEVIASAFYAENWLLVLKSVDYLALDAAPSPVQHYWSLSVEEQFYIGWPLMMWLVLWSSRRTCVARRMALQWTLAIITFASLLYAIYMAQEDPAPGYFLTSTRIWEMGLGGMLAMSAIGRKELSSATREGLVWLGLGCIAFSALFYTPRIPFPGAAALLPTLGTVLVIAAGSRGEGILGRFLALRPMQYVGDLSYALYLWHWPVIIFYPLATGGSLDEPGTVAGVIILSFVLAHLSKDLIEDRFRYGRISRRAGAATVPAFALAGASMLMVVLAVSFPLLKSTNMEAQAKRAALAVGDAVHIGAGIFVRGGSVPEVPYIPVAAFAKLDRGPAYGNGAEGSQCLGDVQDVEVKVCSYGPDNADFHVVLIGDSHAVHWLPAFQRLAEEG